MAIYRMVGEKESLTRIADTSFGEEGVLEREDLQRILRDQPDILEPGLFVIAEEFRDWADSDRRIDLLCVDADGRLVVVELKRGESGELMDLQAIRYAAMVSTITLQQAIDTHQAYLNKRGIDEDAEERVTGHLENSADSQGFSTDQPRIVLVSEGFSSELTTCVLWLNRNGLDITCIRMQPYRNGAELLVDTRQVIPLPEASDYLVRIKEKESEVPTIQKRRSEIVPTVPGGETFRRSISQAPVKFHSGLEHLYTWAVDLEQAGLVELFTSAQGNGNIKLDLRVPGKESQFVAISNTRAYKRGELWFWPDTENLAPESMDLLRELLGPAKSPSGMQFRSLSTKFMKENLESLKSILTAAYREANGLPGDGDDGGDGE